MAHARLGAASKACTIGDEALDSPRVVNSVRTRARDLGSYLARHHRDRPETEAFLHRVNDLSATITQN